MQIWPLGQWLRERAERISPAMANPNDGIGDSRPSATAPRTSLGPGSLVPARGPGPGTWRIPALLVAFSLLPVAAGAVRLFGMAGAGEVTPDNARFLAAPLPGVLHIVSAILWSLLGAFQFSAGLRGRRPGWHRAAGRVLAPVGLLTALSALWLTVAYPLVGHDGPALFFARLIAGAAMALCICLGVAAILRRDVSAHRAWMIRAYGLGLGAGTQVLTHLPYFLFADFQGELSRTICMAAGWGINLVVAERIIRSPAPLRSTAVAVR